MKFFAVSLSTKLVRIFFVKKLIALKICYLVDLAELIEN